MSRIHEALKKAEQERSTVQGADAAALSHDIRDAESEFSRGGVAIATEAAARTTAIMPPSDYLRFDDLRKHCARPDWHPDPNMNVFFNSDTNGHAAEQFRTLRSRLYQLRSTQPLHTLLITSSVPTEGKTFVTSNLAQAIIRQPDRRVLLIDADLRLPRLHVPLGAPRTPGLADYLRGEADETRVIQHGQEGNLCFIAGGNEMKDPSELLSNGRLKTLLERVKPVFDWILIDSPPCLPVADSSMLADFCDGVLFVVRAGVTPAEIALRGCQELQGRNIVGVVLNAVETSHSDGSYYYQNYGYGYGNGHKDSKSSDKPKVLEA